MVALWSVGSGERTGELQCSDRGRDVLGLALRDGRLVTGCAYIDYSVRLWDVRSKARLAVFEGHTDGITSCALGEGVAVSGSGDKTARVWPLDGRTASLATLQHQDEVNAVSVSGATAATGCEDGKVRTWSLQTFECTRVLEHGGNVGVHLVGGALASTNWCGANRVLKLWALGDGGAECVTTLEHGEKNMGNPILAGDAIVTCAEDNKIKIWQPAAAA